MKRQNGTINFLKMASAVFIFLLHCAMYLGFPYFQGGWILVEWFYIFAGYQVTAGVFSKRETTEPWECTLKILWKRISSIYPCYLLSCFLGLLVRAWAGEITAGPLWEKLPYLSEIFMLQMTGIRTYVITDTSWFLSAMWIALLLIVPCIHQFGKNFTRLFAFVIPVLIYGYLDAKCGYLWGPEKWLGWCMKGTLRAVSGLCLGCVSYELASVLRERLQKPVLESALTYAAYLLIFLFMIRFDDSVLYYFIPFVFVILIAVTMAKKPGLDFPDNGLTRFLNRISMILYLNHGYWIRSVERVHPEWSLRHRLVFSAAGTAASVFCVYVAMRIFDHWKNRRKSI